MEIQGQGVYRTEQERKTFEEALVKEWQNYIDRGAATVDALEENTQELAFAKGFKTGYEKGAKIAKGKVVEKACDWLESIGHKYLVETFKKKMEE